MTNRIKPKLTMELVSFGNHVLEDDVPTYMQEIMDSAVRELQAKKEQVIKDKFTEKGFAHLLENIETRRFKKIVVEKYDDREEWWADNGTDEGILIVTFFNPEPQFSNNIDGEFKMVMSYVCLYH